MARRGVFETVGLDFNRVAASAIDAAFGEEKKPREHHPLLATAVGAAAVVGAARVGQKHLPRLAKVPLKAGRHKLGSAASLDQVTHALRERWESVRPEADDEDDYGYDEDEFEDEPEDEDEFEDDAEDEVEDEMSVANGSKGSRRRQGPRLKP
jgi:hypothetical protein